MAVVSLFICLLLYITTFMIEVYYIKTSTRDFLFTDLFSIQPPK